MFSFYNTAFSLKNQPLGTQKKFAPSVVTALNWTMQVRALESEGISVAAQGRDHVNQRLFVAETDDGQLQGFDLKNQIIEQIICTNIGVSHRSVMSQATQYHVPGLPYVPHHTMTIFHCQDTTKGTYDGPFFLPSSEIGVFLTDNTNIQYGQGGFEGASAVYDGAGTICMFRLEAVCERLAKTARSICLPALDIQTCKQAIIDTVAANRSYIPAQNGKLYIRPFIMGTRGGFGVKMPYECMICVEVAAFGSFFTGNVKLQGLKDVFRPITGADKVSGNYTDTFARKKAVKARGYSDYLSFDTSGNIEEVSTCAIGFIKLLAGRVEYHFPPVREDAPDPSQAHTYHSLDSITRRSIIEMLRCLNRTVIVRDIHADELSSFAGMFTMGNAAGVTPVAQVDLCESGDAAVSERIVFAGASVDTVIDHLQALLYAARRGQHTEDVLVKFNESWVDRILC